MASYTLSPVWGAGAQLFDNSGNVLTGGKIYVYAAGTTTPASTYTTPIGNIFNSNPIIADASGRLSNEIWLLEGASYKFVLKDANNVLIATYDNIPTIPQPPIVNDASSISYEQGYTVTAGAFTVGATYRIASVGTTNFVGIGAAANVTGILFTATGVGSGTGTAEYSRTVQAKLREVVSVKDFGAVGDGVTDDTNSFVNLNAAIAGKKGGLVLIPEGTYITSVALKVQGYGIHVLGIGKAVIKPPAGASNTSLTVGEYVPGNLSWMLPLSANLPAGGTSVAISDVRGYAINDMILMVSGVSINSSGANVIPLYKQWFTISGINAGTNTLTFTEQSEYAFNTADDARVSPPTVNAAVRCTIEGIHFTNDTSFVGSYLHLIELAYQVTLRNCAFDGYSACGAALNSDHVVYENCTFVGFNGISSARGTKRITWKDCSYNPRLSPQGISAFIEESPDKVLIDNCDFYGTFRFQSNADLTPPKLLSIRDSRIYSSGVGVVVRAYNNVAFAFDMDKCEIHAPGGLVASTRDAVMSFEFWDSVRIHRTSFFGANPTSYAIDGSSFGANAKLDCRDNLYGTSLGVHPSLPNTAIDLPGTAGIGTARAVKGNAKLSVSDGSVGGTYDANSQVIVERTGGVTGINIKSDATQTGVLSWGNSADPFIAAIQYNHSTNFMTFYANNQNRLLIDNGGNFTPATDDNRTLGSAALRWSEVFAGAPAINTSDEREKQDIDELNEAEKRVAIALKGMIKKFRFKDAVSKKGEAARIHVGVIAQQVSAAFAAEGLDATHYGIFCYDEWKASEHSSAGNRYGVRYDELFAFIIGNL